jgi:hypothetical protein
VKIKLNDVAQKINPWDLSIEIDGKEYKTRAFRMIDAEQAKALDKKDPKATFKFLEQFFVGDKPDLTKLGINELGAILATLVAYANHLTKKNALTMSGPKGKTTSQEIEKLFR